MCHCVCVEVRGELAGVDSPSSTWVMKVELKSSDLVVCAFTHQAISLVSIYYFLILLPQSHS